MRTLIIPHDYSPREYQAPFYDYMTSHVVGGRAFWCVHRRGGKDLTSLHAITSNALERVGVYWHCLPVYEQARKAIWRGFTAEGKRIVDNVWPQEIVRRKNEQEMFVELTNGSIVQLVGSDNIDTLVGAGPVHVTFSEFALSRPSSWDLVRPILRENQGSAAFITTPRGRNHAFKLRETARSQPGWFCETMTLQDTGAWKWWKKPMGGHYASADEVLESERAEGMEESMIRQEYLCDFTAALVGSFYGDLMEALEKDGRISEFEHSKDEILTIWDLGISDSTAVWFMAVKDDGVDFIDHYEAHGKPMSHYFDMVESKPYRYTRHYLPHDARARTLQTGESIIEQCVERWGLNKVAISPKLSVPDGIQATRWLLQRNTRFHSRCDAMDGIEALRQYHREWDEDKRAYRDHPTHDWSSHSADAMRYAAVIVKMNQMLRRPEAPKKPVKFGAPLAESYTLEMLYEAEERERPDERRIP